MVKIYLRSQLGADARAIAIKIIERKMRRIRLKRGLEFFGQPRFARAAAADNRDEQRLAF